MSNSFWRSGLIVAILVTSLCLNTHLAQAPEITLIDWTSPTLQNLLSVFMVGPGNGWAVGGLGTVIHWDGTQWANASSPTTHTLYSVSMVNATDGWAVGISGTIIHWDGKSWENVSTPTLADVFSVCMVNAITDGP